MRMRDRNALRSDKGDRQSDYTNLVRQDAGAMIVLAHVAGQRGPLIDLDLLRAALVGQCDEGIEANLLGARRGASRSAGANGGARRIGAPPVVRCGNGRTAPRSLVTEILA